jgi:hypothetical protein
MEEQDQILLVVDGEDQPVPAPPELPIENTPRIIHFSIGSPVIEGNPVIPINVVGNIPCVGFYVSTNPAIPTDAVWTEFPPQTINIETQ